MKNDMYARCMGLEGKASFHGKSKKAFTLIEMIVGMLLITLIGVSFLASFTTAYTGFFSLGKETQAVNEAQSLIELYYTNPANIDSTWMPVADVADLTPDLLTAHPTYSKFYALEDTTNNGQAVEKITVLVFYSNNTKQVNVSAFVR